jgi:hypothetical protein
VLAQVMARMERFAPVREAQARQAAEELRAL